jgi:hypothetical protein
MKLLIKATIVVLTIVTGIATADTLTLRQADISDDVYIKRSAPSQNFGKDNFLIVATNSGPNDESRSLLKFNLPKLSGVVVKKAILTLSSAFGSTNLQMTQRIYKATAAWSRGTATWDSDSSNFDSSDPDVSTLKFTPVGPEKNGTAFKFDVTAIVNSWLKKPDANHGFFILNDADDKGMIGYYSTNIGYASPQLTIEYTQDSQSGDPSPAK